MFSIHSKQGSCYSSAPNLEVHLTWTIKVINEKNESSHAHKIKETCTQGFDELDDFTSFTINFQSSL
jgi:hypothetical protein